MSVSWANIAAWLQDCTAKENGAQKMGRIFYIMGKSATGKDTVFKELLKRMAAEGLWRKGTAGRRGPGKHPAGAVSSGNGDVCAGICHRNDVGNGYRGRTPAAGKGPLGAGSGAGHRAGKRFRQNGGRSGEQGTF